EGLRDEREDERVAERLPERRALERALHVGEADEAVRVAGDLRVAEGEPEREEEREADEGDDVEHRRDDHHGAQEALAIEQRPLDPRTCRGPAERGLFHAGRPGCYLFHFAKIRFMSASACLAESSGDCSPLATRANMSGTTKVLKTSSIAAVVWPG